MALAAAASLTLVPEGTGWAWGAPLTELRWYLTGLTSPATPLQLVGNLLLIAVPAVLAVRLWPALAHPARLAAAALAAGGTIEVLQFLPPLGRVVSPVDALLNAAGALVTGAVVAATDRDRRRGRRGAATPRPDGTSNRRGGRTTCLDISLACR
ncbi:VanZ family protein [Geodermatophilus sp. URMC 63]